MFPTSTNTVASSYSCMVSQLDCSRQVYSVFIYLLYNSECHNRNIYIYDSSYSKIPSPPGLICHFKHINNLLQSKDHNSCGGFTHRTVLSSQIQPTNLAVFVCRSLHKKLSFVDSLHIYEHWVCNRNLPPKGTFVSSPRIYRACTEEKPAPVVRYSLEVHKEDSYRYRTLVNSTSRSDSRGLFWAMFERGPVQVAHGVLKFSEWGRHRFDH
jgi:hypothetical protein